MNVRRSEACLLGCCIQQRVVGATNAVDFVEERQDDSPPSPQTWENQDHMVVREQGALTFLVSISPPRCFWPRRWLQSPYRRQYSTWAILYRYPWFTAPLLHRTTMAQRVRAFKKKFLKHLQRPSSSHVHRRVKLLCLNNKNWWYVSKGACLFATDIPSYRCCHCSIGWFHRIASSEGQMQE